MLIGGLSSFVVLGFLLKPSDYGIFGSVQALVAPAFTLALMGSPVLLLRRISGGAPTQASWSRLMSSAVAGGVAATVLLLVLRPLLLGPAPILPYVLLVLSYGLLSHYADLQYMLATAVGRMDRAAAGRTLATLPRLVALGIFALGSVHTLERWAWFVVCANLLGTVASVVYGRHGFGVHSGRLKLGTIAPDAREGYGYALNGLSAGVLDASDRPILVNNGLADDAGYYNLGARLLSFSYLPIMAVLRATGAEVFRAGGQGISESMEVSKRVLRPVVGLAIVISVGLFTLAPVVNVLLPDGYETVIDVLRWFSLMPIIKGFQFVGGNALDAAALQLVRFRMTLGAATLNLVLNLILIPHYSWRAAVGSTLLAETVLAASLWWYGNRLANRPVIAEPSLAGGRTRRLLHRGHPDEP